MKRLPEDLIKKEEELIKYSGRDKVVSFFEMETFTEEKKPQRIFSLFPRLDELVDGFESGELVIVSGLPKSGKSLLCQTLTYQFAKNGILSVWFSYELTPGQFLKRFPVLPLSYMPARMEANIISWIEERIWEAKLKYGVRVAFIDHLHYLVDMARMRNPSLEIGTVLRNLKLLAINHNIVIFLICHTGKVERGKRPRGEDIRDSSFALQEPDTVLMIWRIKDNPTKGIENEARLSIEMTRRSGVLSKVVKLKKIDGWLTELTEEGGAKDE
jgi:replicative DNA helicase